MATHSAPLTSPRVLSKDKLPKLSAAAHSRDCLVALAPQHATQTGQPRGCFCSFSAFPVPCYGCFFCVQVVRYLGYEWFSIEDFSDVDHPKLVI